MRTAILRTFITMIFFYCCTTLYAQEVKTICFKPGSYGIDKKYLPALDKIGMIAVSDSFIFLRIFAYADTKGSLKHNEVLSEKRANEVHKYLTGKFNIDSTKVYVAWLGEEIDGAYDIHFPNAHVQQRCVDILVYYRRKQ